MRGCSRLLNGVKLWSAAAVARVQEGQHQEDRRKLAEALNSTHAHLGYRVTFLMPNAVENYQIVFSKMCFRGFSAIFSPRLRSRVLAWLARTVTCKRAVDVCR